MVGDEVDPAEVHGLVAAVEADVALLGLARVARRPDHQPLDVGQDALVLRVRVGGHRDGGGDGDGDGDGGPEA